MHLKGGLGNMLFQIAAGISFSTKSNTDLCLINLHSHFKYLDIDEIYQPKLKHSFEYLKLNQFKNFNVKPNIINPLKLITFPFEYVNYLPPCDHVIEGFFQSEKYFINERQSILSHFRPSDEIKNLLKKYDFTNFKTTSIHVRRGDYLNNPDYHTVQSKEYYYEAIEITKNKTDKYLIFSDDLEWCKNNFKGEEFIFIENEKDYVEIYLMSLCNNNIISNSSFSWWGAWMNENDQKIIIGPKKWFGPKDKTLTDKDIIPEKWLKI